jgi:hypothetical protein
MQISRMEAWSARWIGCNFHPDYHDVVQGQTGDIVHLLKALAHAAEFCVSVRTRFPGRSLSEDRPTLELGNAPSTCCIGWAK